MKMTPKRRFSHRLRNVAGSLQKRDLCSLNFSYVHPEPVLVSARFFSIKWHRKNEIFRTLPSIGSSSSTSFGMCKIGLGLKRKGVFFFGSPSFLESFLCLSRVCLGKAMIFSIKNGKQDRFLTCPSTAARTCAPSDKNVQIYTIFIAR